MEDLIVPLPSSYREAMGYKPIDVILAFLYLKSTNKQTTHILWM